MNLDTNGADIEEFTEDCKEELMIEELAALQSWQKKVLIEEYPLRKKMMGRESVVMRQNPLWKKK